MLRNNKNHKTNKHKKDIGKNTKIKGINTKHKNTMINSGKEEELDNEKNPSLSSQDLIQFIHNHNTNTPLIIVVDYDKNDPHLSLNLFKRISQKGKLVALITLDELLTINASNIFANPITLFISAHGVPNRISSHTGDEFAELILPLFKKFSNIQHLKFSACYSGAKLLESDIPDYLKDNENLQSMTKSLVETVSQYLANKGYTPEVHGYIGSVKELRTAQIWHSFVELPRDKDKLIRAKEGRVTFFGGKKIKDPNHIGKLENSINLTDSKGSSRKFKLTH